MEESRIGGIAVFLSDVIAGPGEGRCAAAVVGVSAIVCLLLVPFAKAPLAPVPAFIPIYQSALLIIDLMTAVFLLGQARFAHGRPLTLLACGYLFTALMSTVHALTFPGLFAPAGLLHAGPQTTAWLYVFWHGAFPCFVMAYALCRTEERSPASGGFVPLTGVGLVLALVCGVTLLATIGRDALPILMRANRYAPLAIIVFSAIWMLNLAAALLLARRRPHTVLDLWMMVVMCAWLFDIALGAMLNGGRFDLGFYAGRIYGLLAASLVLAVLLCGNSRLYLQLITLHHSEREKSARLRHLSAIDALTGIANRRAFDEALSREWRRTLRHGTPLSLLLIDVDFFKRFNDAYGHVAGDVCLREVAQTIAGRARRAGELAARYGGEEFAVLLPQIDTGEAARLAELICKAVRDCAIPHRQSAAAPSVTVSIGVASVNKLPDAAATLSREGVVPAAFAPGATVLVETADHALYEAKNAGRNRVVVAGPNDAADLAAAMELNPV